VTAPRCRSHVCVRTPLLPLTAALDHTHPLPPLHITHACSVPHTLPLPSPITLQLFPFIVYHVGVEVVVTFGWTFCWYVGWVGLYPTYTFPHTFLPLLCLVTTDCWCKLPALPPTVPITAPLFTPLVPLPHLPQRHPPPPTSPPCPHPHLAVVAAAACLTPTPYLTLFGWRHLRFPHGRLLGWCGNCTLVICLLVGYLVDVRLLPPAHYTPPPLTHLPTYLPRCCVGVTVDDYTFVTLLEPLQFVVRLLLCCGPLCPICSYVEDLRTLPVPIVVVVIVLLVGAVIDHPTPTSTPPPHPHLTPPGDTPNPPITCCAIVTGYTRTHCCTGLRTVGALVVHPRRRGLPLLLFGFVVVVYGY